MPVTFHSKSICTFPMPPFDPRLLPYSLNLLCQVADKLRNHILGRICQGTMLSIKGYNVGAKGHNIDTKGYNADVKGHNVGVKEHNVDAKGYNVDVKGHNVVDKGIQCWR